MAIIKIHKTQFSKDRETRFFNGNLLDWLLKQDVIEHNAPVMIYRNGSLLVDSTNGELSTTQMNEAVNIELSAFDSVDIIAPVAGTLALIGVLVGALVLSVALAPRPEKPNGMGDDKNSPNNQLNAATNQFRQGQAIPDISGLQRSYPDFVQPSFYVYENNRRRFTEVLIIGRGQHEVAGVFDATTNFDDIPSSSYEIYQGGDNIPSDVLVDVRAAEGSIDYALDPIDDAAIIITINNGSFVGENTITAGPNDNFTPLQLQIGTLVDIDVQYEFSGQFVSYTETRDVVAFGADFIEFSSSTINPFPSARLNSVSGTLRNDDSDTSDIFFTLDGSLIEGVRVQLKAPSGVADAGGGKLSIQYYIIVQQIDSQGADIGGPIQRTDFMAGQTRAPQWRTQSFNNLPAGRYKVSVRRVTPRIPDAADELVLERIESITPYSGKGFGDVQVLVCYRSTPEQSSSSVSGKINAEVIRKLELFDPITGTFADGVFTATRSFAQYVMYVLCKQAGISVDDVDYVTLFDIEASLSQPELGYFDATFDDEDVAVKERVQAACNAARVKAYEAGEKWLFVREEPQPFPVAILTRRDLAPSASKQSWKAYRDGDFDSISIVYTDPETNSEAYVDRKINTLGGIEEGLGDNVDIIELFGCRNRIQAKNRAELEIRRLRYQRYQISDTELGKLSMVSPGERFRWCDINDSDIFHGEVLGQDGNVFTTSEPFEPEPGIDYYVYLTDANGDVSAAVLATARSDGNKFGFEAAGLTASIANGYEIQQGSVYIIAPDESINATDFILLSREGVTDSGEIEFTAAVYDERMFDEDTYEDISIPLVVTGFNNLIEIDTPSCDDETVDIIVAASGGLGSYTYSWIKIGGDGDIIGPTNDPTLLVNMQSVCPGQTLSGVYQCTVTDGDQAKSVNVVASARNNYTLDELVLTVSAPPPAAYSTPECVMTPMVITSTVTGGSGTYTYSWIKIGGDGAIVGSSTGDSITVQFDPICLGDSYSGTYQLTVSDGFSQRIASATVSAQNSSVIEI